MRLETYAGPVLGPLPVDCIELAHVVEALNRDDLWTTKPETASRVRSRIEAVLNWATIRGYRSGDNPAGWRGNLDAVLPKPTKLKRVQHHKAPPIPGMHRFIVALRKREGMATRALEFLVLTAARSGEVRGAVWSEIDLEARASTIPAERMKACKEHVVPLTSLRSRCSGPCPTSRARTWHSRPPRGGMLSDMTLSAVMRRIEVDAVPRGFRSTFRDGCSACTSYPHEVAEMALAHTIPKRGRTGLPPGRSADQAPTADGGLGDVPGYGPRCRQRRAHPSGRPGRGGIGRRLMTDRNRACRPGRAMTDFLNARQTRQPSRRKATTDHVAPLKILIAKMERAHAEALSGKGDLSEPLNVPMSFWNLNFVVPTFRAALAKKRAELWALALWTKEHSPSRN